MAEINHTNFSTTSWAEKWKGFKPNVALYQSFPMLTSYLYLSTPGYSPRLSLNQFFKATLAEIFTKFGHQTHALYRGYLSSSKATTFSRPPWPRSITQKGIKPNVAFQMSTPGSKLSVQSCANEILWFHTNISRRPWLCINQPPLTSHIPTIYFLLLPYRTNHGGDLIQFSYFSFSLFVIFPSINPLSRIF